LGRSSFSAVIVVIHAPSGLKELIQHEGAGTVDDLMNSFVSKGVPDKKEQERLSWQHC